MYWYSIAFDAQQVKEGRSIDFLREFGESVVNADFPHGLALFRYRAPVDSESAYYLPPSANKLCAHLVERYSATAAPKPARLDLKVAIGPKEAIDYWFREADEAGKTESVS